MEINGNNIITSYGNTAVSKPHVIGVRRPLDASDNNLSGTYPMDANDFLIDEGNSNTISNIQSCDKYCDSK